MWVATEGQKWQLIKYNIEKKCGWDGKNVESSKERREEAT